MKPVILEDKHRGVYFGFSEDKHGVQHPATGARSVVLKGARCAIYWGTTGGVVQLAAEGPTDKSRVGSTSPGELLIDDVIKVHDVSPEAAEKWVGHATYGG